MSVKKESSLSTCRNFFRELLQEKIFAWFGLVTKFAIELQYRRVFGIIVSAEIDSSIVLCTPDDKQFQRQSDIAPAIRRLYASHQIVHGVCS